jgi:GntR family transcriptional regulator, transcriptional repressor for pyruvate dehydrogenase complex
VSDRTSLPDGLLGSVPPKPRLSDRVAEDIIETIVAQRLQPGDALPPERELGEQFGVSRTVIREAVRALDARGLLDVRVGSRIRVAAVHPETVRDAVWHFARSSAIDRRAVSEVCDALAVAAAELAAERATADDIERLGRVLPRLHAGSRDLRRELTAAAHNELLKALADALEPLSPPESQPHSAPPARAATAALVASIGRRDPEGARRAMRQLLGHRERAGTADG